MAKYREGQKVRIIKNIEGHGFEIGEIVRIFSVEAITANGQNYIASGIGRYKDLWWVIDKELSPLITNINKQVKVL